MSLRILMNGCCGYMGRCIAAMCKKDPEIDVVCGIYISDNTEGLDFPVFSDASAVDVDFDVIVDFSHFSCIPKIVEFAVSRKKPIVCCTTGLTEEHLKLLDDASKEIPVFKSANMSLGINVMIALCRKMTNLLYPDYDIEIVEAHHNRKLDAPSGTALMIADAIKDEIDNEVNYVYDRQSVRRKREQTDIGISSIRGGNIVGEHEVMYIGGEEILKISHSAQTRDVFARGALAAARFVFGKEPGYYDMTDMIQL